MQFNTILYSKNQGVTTITLNRPESYNAFTEEMRTEMLTAINAASVDAECRVVVLTGAGKAFCSGQDLKDIRSEEHTSELQSRSAIVCRLLLEKKNKRKITPSENACLRG